MVVVVIPQRLGDLLFPMRDPGFGPLLAELSEPDAGRSADNFVSNEDSFGRVCDDLAGRDGVYLGVGPDQNFSYIARAWPSLAFIVDFRRRNALVHLLHKGLMALAPDRVGYLARLTARVPGPMPANPSADDLVAAFATPALDRARLEATVAEVLESLRPLGVLGEGEASAIASIASRLAGPGMNARFLALPMYPTFGDLIRARTRAGKPAHFLADEASYQAVRERQMGDRILPVVGDFAGPKALGAIGALLARAGRKVAVAYVSDVEFFLLRSGKFPAYVANLGRLPWADGAVIVRTSTREIAHPERVAGDSSTTIVRPVAPFLERARAGEIRSDADLFR
ncbi:hypothetical protein TA3x_003326 [Tundrisphaera sp. TA3]|uniref:LIC_10091 family protein n=1 Tax=Tundrisphaera sp. TA3 TaxID=3435775 RepID=UPI003EC08C07